MIHAKKLILDGENGHDKINDDVFHNIPEASAPSSSYVRMDSEMQDILNNKILSEFDKWVLYKQVLERYLEKLKNQKISKLKYINKNFDLNDDEGQIKNDPQHIPQNSALEELKDFTVGAAAVKARLLYAILEKCSSIDWDEVGRVSIMGISTGALIKDYINASLKRNVTTKPQGWELYCRALKALKLPHSYVSNKELQNILKDPGAPPISQQMPSTSAGLQESLEARPARAAKKTRGNGWTPY